MPRGAYYRIDAKSYTKPFNDASYFRHKAPLHLHDGNLSREEIRSFHSNAGAKVGPAPSWTSPLALTRYPLFPIGIRLDANGEIAGQRPQREMGGGRTAFDVQNVSRVQRLLSLKDGELIEVEQWGGWVMSECPPICGLWGNIWKGTGLTMRVSKPFVALSKITAIVQMILNVGARNVTALAALASVLKFDSEVAMAHAKYPEAKLAECLAFVLLTHQRKGPLQHLEP